MSGLLQAVKFIRHPKFAHHGQSEFFVLISSSRKRLLMLVLKPVTNIMFAK